MSFTTSDLIVGAHALLNMAEQIAQRGWTPQQA
jgi:hypothetical protein